MRRLKKRNHDFIELFVFRIPPHAYEDSPVLDY
jgi:hypothetical protein